MFLVAIAVIGVLIGAFMVRSIIHEATALLTIEEKAALTNARNLNPVSVAVFAAVFLVGVLALYNHLALLGAFVLAAFVFAFFWEAALLQKEGVPRTYIKTYLTAIVTYFFGVWVAVAIVVALLA